ncbi:MAG: hypothetical protein GY817_05620 [bacterium]|nr:hypothetical protein [bacterium]
MFINFLTSNFLKNKMREKLVIFFLLIFFVNSFASFSYYYASTPSQNLTIFSTADNLKILTALHVQKKLTSKIIQDSFLMSKELLDSISEAINRIRNLKTSTFAKNELYELGREDIQHVCLFAFYFQNTRNGDDFFCKGHNNHFSLYLSKLSLKVLKHSYLKLFDMKKYRYLIGIGGYKRNGIENKTLNNIYILRLSCTRLIDGGSFLSFYGV